jgi:hypothetical protein
MTHRLLRHALWVALFVVAVFGAAIVTRLPP